MGSGFLIPILTKSFLAQQTDLPAERTEGFVRAQNTCVERAAVQPPVELGGVFTDPANVVHDANRLEESARAYNVPRPG